MIGDRLFLSSLFDKATIYTCDTEHVATAGNGKPATASTARLIVSMETQ